MELVGFSCLRGVSSSFETDFGLWDVEDLAQKVQRIWDCLYDVTIGNLVRVVHVARSAMGAIIREVFFFPLSSVLTQVQCIRDYYRMDEALKNEEAFYRDFWNSEKPIDPNLELHQDIRDLFLVPRDHHIPIELKNGTSVTITCRIIETKQQEGKFYNFVQVPGLYTTISNNIGTTHPYLAAYVKAARKEGEISPARFFVVSANNFNFKPSNLDEAGFVLVQALQALKRDFGQIDHVVAHSLGTVFLANALTQIQEEAMLPRHVCLDRGPRSTWEASKRYLWGFGVVFYCFAKCGEWASDLEEDLTRFYEKWKEKTPSLLVTGVIDDHHFAGEANLCLGKKLDSIPGLDRAVFKPPRQVVNERAHHNLMPSQLRARYLVQESRYMEPLENLSSAIIRHSFKLVTQLELVGDEAVSA